MEESPARELPPPDVSGACLVLMTKKTLFSFNFKGEFFVLLSQQKIKAVAGGSHCGCDSCSEGLQEPSTVTPRAPCAALNQLRENVLWPQGILPGP